MTVRIVNADVLAGLAQLPDESVHMCVTSPPYLGLRDYGIPPQVWSAGAGLDCIDHEWGDSLISSAKDSNRGSMNWTTGGDPAAKVLGERVSQGAFCQRCGAWRGSLGLEPTVDLYVEHMVAVFREVRRVLRRDGTLWLNIGDSYADKQLLGVPWMLAFALRADGWWLRSEITWAKRAPMPESCTDRPTVATEKVFLLAKSGDSTYWTHRDRAGSRLRPAPDYCWVDRDNGDAETDVEPENWRSDQKRWRRINLWSAHDYFYDVDAVKEEADGDTHSRGNKRAPPIENAGIGHKGWSAYMTRRDDEIKSSGKRNQRNFWLLGPEPFPEAHFATFVSEIPRRAILAGTSERGVCPKCAAPWVRVVEKGNLIGPGHENYVLAKSRAAIDDKTNRARSEGWWPNHKLETKTLGWRPTCGCDAGEPVPATVLEPFAGAFTTCLVAEQLRRDSIGIELNPEYCEMGRRRLATDAPLFFAEAAQ